MNLFGLMGSRYRRRGSKHLLNEEWELAAAEFQKSIARNPNCVESRQGLGIALMKQELWREGEVVLEKAVASCPDLPASLHAQLGMARMQLSRWPEALIALTQATETEPDSAEYQELRGQVLLQLEDWSEAVTAFTRSTEIEPDRAVCHRHRGAALMKLERWQEALAAFTKATEIEPGQAEFHGLRGTALLKVGLWQEAALAYDSAIELNPNEFSFHEAQAHALFELGRFEDTVAASHRCIELKSDVASVHVRVGAALLKLGRDADAVAALQQAVKINPDLADVHEMLGHAFARLGENEQAIEAFQRMIKLDPSAKTRIAVSLAELGFVDEQDITDLRAKVESDPDCYDSLLQLASLLSTKQNWDETIETAQRALTLRPESRECHKLIGDAYLAQGKYEPAVECFRTALHKFSEYNFVGDYDELSVIRNCYQGLARALAKLDRVDESLEVLQRQLNVTFDPVTCLEIGREFQKQQKDDLATRSFVRAIVMNHNHLDAYKALGDHLEETGGSDEALIVYEEVTAMGLGDDELRTRLAQSRKKVRR